MRLTTVFQVSSRGPLVQVLKTSVATITAWLLCNILLNQPLPIFAAIAALLVVQPSVNQSLSKGVERSIGVVAGVLLAFGVGLLFGTASWIVLGVIVLSLLLAWALRLTPGSANQIPISAMLVLSIGAQTPDYAVNRIIETVIGAVVALLVNVVIVPPVMLQPAHLAVSHLAHGVADTLDSLSAALRSRQTPTQREELLTEARALRPLRDTAISTISRAEESLMFNPRGGKHRTVLEHDRRFLGSLTALATQVLGMTRAVHDHYDEELTADPIVKSIAVELNRAAHDLRLLARGPSQGTLPSDEPPTTAELPALTAPLVIARPNQQNWILVGSLLEDLRRVREGIIGSND
ncbi:MAG: FUSC family protein [Lacisediminihabitans sp.]